MQFTTDTSTVAIFLLANYYNHHFMAIT